MKHELGGKKYILKKLIRLLQVQMIIKEYN